MRYSPFMLTLILLVTMNVTSSPKAQAQSPIQERHALEKENAELKTRNEELEGENATLRSKLADTRTSVRAEPVNAKAKFDEAPAAKPVKGGFGKTRWGMSVKEVRRHYPKLRKEGEYYIKEHAIDGVDGILAFDFHEGALVSVVFLSTERYTNKNEHLSDFDTIAGLLKQKYGEPDLDEATWDNDLYSDDPSSYGMAISLGHLDIKKSWDQEGTRVGLALSGQNFKVSLTLVYMDLAGMAKQDAAKEDAILDEL